MVCKFFSILIVLIAITSTCLVNSLQAAEGRPPAGQMCTDGAFVSGFDSDGNIICSVPGGAGLPATVATVEKANDQDDGGCLQDCPNETGETGTARVTVTMDKVVKNQVAAGNETKPVISDVKPSWIVFGARETALAIIGGGFNADSVVKFHGSTYEPSVNTEGTELRVTIATRELPIGRYAITVSNGDGLEVTQRRALEVY